VLLNEPRVRAALRPLERREHPTRTQARALRRVAKEIGNNPALKLLIKKGRALKRDPAALASDVAALLHLPRTSAAPPGIENGRFNALAIKVQGTTVAALRGSFGSRVRKILSEPGVVGYLERLPPLVLASLIPPEQLASFALPAVRAKTSVFGLRERQIVATFLSVLAIINLNDKVQDLALAITTDGGAALLASEALAGIGIVATAGPWVLAGTVGAFALLSAKDVTEDLAKTIVEVLEALIPEKLLLTPASETITPEKHVTYQAEGIAASGKHITGLNLTLQITNGKCYGRECTATKAGPHTVTATYKVPLVGTESTGTASLNVEPGPAVRLKVVPQHGYSIAQGESEAFTVEGEDHWENPFVVMIGPDAIDATLSIAEGFCTGNTCTAQSLGPHVVTVTLGDLKAETTMYIDPAADHLVLSPEHVSIAVGESQAYTVEAYSATNEDLGPVTDKTELSINSGGCFEAEHICTPPDTPGTYTVTAKYGNAEGKATLEVKDGNPGAWPTSFSVSIKGYVVGYSYAPENNVIGLDITITGTRLNCTAEACAYQVTDATGTLYGYVENLQELTPCSLPESFPFPEDGFGQLILTRTKGAILGALEIETEDIVQDPVNNNLCFAGTFLGTPGGGEFSIGPPSQPVTEGAATSTWTVVPVAGYLPPAPGDPVMFSSGATITWTW
jgi:hypothetical protein